MKFALLILAVAGVGLINPTNSEVINELGDFLAIIPVGKIIEIASNHLENDNEFQAAIQYMQSQEWVDMVHALRSTPPVIEMRNILKTAGLDLTPSQDIETSSSPYHHLPYVEVDKDQKRSFAKYFADLKEVFPTDNIKALIAEKMENSPIFGDFMKNFGDKMHTLLDETLMSPEYKAVAAELTNMDMPIDTLIDTLYDYLGWKKNERKSDLPANSLNADYVDLISLIPMAEIQRVLEDHLENDIGFRAGLKYLQSDEWKSLASAAINTEAAAEWMKSKKGAGFDIEGILNMFHNIVQSVNPADIPEGTKADFGAFFKELYAVLPIDKFLEMINEKMESNPAFKEFYNNISREEMKKLSTDMTESIEFKNASAALEKIGVPFTAILKMIYEFMDWS